MLSPLKPSTMSPLLFDMGVCLFLISNIYPQTIVALVYGLWDRIYASAINLTKEQTPPSNSSTENKIKTAPKFCL